MRRRFLLRIIAAILLATLVFGNPVAAFTGIVHADNINIGDTNPEEFIIDKNGLLVKYNGDSDEVVVPEGVIGIAQSAFQACSNLIKIKLPEGVTDIGNYAFNECSSLTEVNLPESVTNIGNYAFYRCSLTKINLPEGITDIKEGTFYQCSKLTEVELPKKLLSIEAHVFDGCENLTEINLPEKVSSIGEYAFYECNSLTEINLPEELSSIGDFAFAVCDGLTSIELPAGVSKIGYGCISGDSLISIDVSPYNNNYVLYDNCLYNKDLTELLICPSGKTEIKFSENIVSIGGYAFFGCSKLTKIKLPEKVTSIGVGAFCGCSSLTEVNLPEELTSVGNRAFFNCRCLTQIKLPERITSIGDEAFVYCSSLTELKLPESVSAIGREAFCQCYGLTEIVLPKMLTSIEFATFAGCGGLIKVKLPEGLTSIGNDAFYECSRLTEINLPEKVMNIGNYAFFRCNRLTELKLSEELTNIEDNAFDECDNLTIYGIKDSYVHAYALKHQIPFQPVENMGKLVLEKDGIQMIADENGQISEDISLFVKNITNIFADKDILEQLKEGYILKQGYDISIYQGKDEVQLKELVTVKIPVPENGRQGYKIFRAEADSSLIDMKAVQKGNYLVFVTEYLGEYIVVQSSSILEIGETRTQVFADRIIISWEPINNAKGYNIYVDNKKVNTDLVTDNTYIIKGLEKDTNYNISITVFNDAGESEKSEIISIKTGNILLGDINKDEKINIIDAMKVFHYVSGRSKNIDINLADINRDGKVNIIDAMKVFHYVSGRNKEM